MENLVYRIKLDGINKVELSLSDSRIELVIESKTNTCTHILTLPEEELKNVIFFMEDCLSHIIRENERESDET